ncbi:metalloregulator ArsR/SmtB family transcription factor [Oceanospirillum linum]|nr:metalloregulator ArsR/SmtB family transcription factor [Oceanospirillum linum]SEG44475.1 transcriptional regulator, ArsR family [Oleiphilus messinensis]SMP34362.1 transcriptional regulator, ArsR family [Oceanospirillum linum]
MHPLQFFKCLSDDTRLKSILIISELKEVCVCDLMAGLELDQPKVSRHLAALRKCNILRDERRGKWVYYSLHEDLPEWARQVIRQTAEENQIYFSEALKKLMASKQNDLTC